MSAAVSGRYVYIPVEEREQILTLLNDCIIDSGNREPRHTWEFQQEMEQITSRLLQVWEILDPECRGQRNLPDNAIDMN